ncbi:hypothetical protein [Pseudomonas sp. PDM22]|uniref:hypothetical protein n=1 Tax=Pseudomonas sp. PDM22 TaxID=2769287 RepID=UPI0009DB095C|nr:hypothetical protein [Pseudomonas sp. PDM22]MBD9515404.1 hypothetical protein [Pseudomonas sp. PDM22]OQR38152.1 hypothetical protein BWR15_01155 [Pseudomonas sp. T]
MPIFSTTPATGRAQITASRILQWLIHATVMILLVGIVAPIAPRLPDMGLDASWAVGIQEALAQRLVIGQDVVFTFGPYASLFTFMYHPQSDLLGVISGTILGAIYGTLLLINYRRLPAWAILAATLAFCWLGVISKDSLLFAYPLLLALTLHQLLGDGAGKHGARTLFILCTVGLGLLPLIKGSLLPLCLSVGALCSLLAWIRKEHTVAISTLLLPPLAALIFWLAAGQPLSALLQFFHNILPIISGYTIAMATYGDNRAIITYVIVSGLILISLLPGRRPRLSTLFLLLAFALYLFLSFKAAFVRVDHVAIALGSLLIAILLLANHIPKPLFALCLAGGVALALQVPSYDLLNVRGNLADRYISAGRAIAERITSPGKLATAYQQRLTHLHQEDPVRMLSGTSDIYPWDITTLIASGNKWAPRPVFQSYSAYTPALALANESHLRSQKSPDNLFVKVTSIDGRFPALEDGASWPTMLRNYAPISLDGNYLVLHRERLDPVDLDSGLVHTQTATLGQAITIPRYSGALFARISMKQTLQGKISKTLYKSGGLSINLELRNGERRKFHFVPSMAESGFVVSPLIEDAFDLALLADGPTKVPVEKEVTSFWITKDDSSSDWQESLQVQFIQVDIPPRHAPVENLFAAHASPSQAMLDARENPSCEGHIDSLNREPASSSEVLSRTLQVTGWTAISSTTGQLADQVFISLRNENGEMSFYAAQTQMRPDLAAYFKSPTMDRAGITSTIDARSLSGNYEIGVLRRSGSEYEHCKLLQAPVAINIISQPIQSTAAMLQASPNAQCEGHVDSIAGVSVDGAAVTGDYVDIEGWTALSSVEAKLPEDVFIKLTDEKGQNRIYPTRPQRRPDVSNAFKNPRLANAGYIARVDTRGLSGRFHISVLRTGGGPYEECPGPKDAVSINLNGPSNLASLALQNARPSTSCEGHLDSINGKPTGTPVKTGENAAIEGWTVLSSAEGKLPEHVFVTLQDHNGVSRIFPTEAVARSDVSSLFKNEKLIQSGFLARFDTHELSGEYRVGIVRSNGDQFERCQSLDQTITLN